jgi:thiopurine S-methyltransferase
MDRQFWLERWQQGAIGFHQAQVNADLRQYWPLLRCPPDASVFVPLCGKSRDMRWLRAQGHHVLGIDLSELAVQDFFAEQELSPLQHRSGRLACWQADGYELYVGDFFELPAAALSRVSAVYDRAALVALPPPLRLQYAQQLSALLPPRCRMLLLTMVYAQQQMSGPPFAVPEPEVHELFDAAFSVALLGTRDTLATEPRLQQRGLTELHEQAFLLERRA